ncbi:RrF2 family transcriptional regulator [Qiania dongpingensis]|uniref:Rrf2 family transcriptional regulator n=1 Tax=Qiania dongpingensis TaxID=2763669 RepID=A0A7G9G3I4_9FIRM|nr:Rrf2 family transcriptional regulator [Qiania dongpingensis]QNM05366.1 Rrf2 family transcriptional regulator [Qiania dongpingensis]
MKLSTKGRYGLRAMVDLAETSEEGPVSIQTIAKRQDLSDKYLEQLLGMLKKAGLVKSVRGTQGGYQIVGDMAQISVGDILRALEGDLTLVDCAGLEKDGACKTAKFCVTKYVWKKIHENLEDTVDHITLKELVEQSKSIQAGTWEEE